MRQEITENEEKLFRNKDCPGVCSDLELEPSTNGLVTDRYT